MTHEQQQRQHAARETGRSDGSRYTPLRRDRSVRLAAVTAAGLAATALLAGCGAKDSEAYAPKKVSGQAAPVLGNASKDGAKKKGDDSSSSPSKSGGGGGGGGGNDDRTSSTSPSEGKGGAGSSGGASGGSGGGSSGGAGPCRTSHLSLSAAAGGNAGDVVVNMKNTGSDACTLTGFPGADLKGNAGTISASRTDLPTSTVTVQPGEATHFTLSYPPNESGGTGASFTGLIVNPPNETASKTVPVSVNLAAADTDGPLSPWIRSVSDCPGVGPRGAGRQRRSGYAARPSAPDPRPTPGAEGGSGGEAVVPG